MLAYLSKVIFQQNSIKALAICTSTTLRKLKVQIFKL
jgi:hypothetical protein